LLVRDSGNNQLLRVNNNGNVGIGTSNPLSILHVGSGSDANVPITLAPASGGNIEFRNTSSTGSFTFTNANGTSEAMRIDSSGNLLVGKTSTSSNVAGHRLNPRGDIEATRSGGLVSYFNRQSSDGDISVFAKDGTTVGSIYNGGGNLGVNSSGGLLLIDDIITPTSAADATHDIGRSSARYKDLYLSGGVYLGGTGSANKLEDYETGSWTPTWLGTGSNPTVSYDTQEGRYVKIGSFVYVKVRLDIISSSGGSGTLLLDGLPFTATNDSGALGVASLGYKTGFVTQGPDFGRCVTSYIEMYYDNGTAEVAISPANLGSGTQCIFAAVYTTTQ